jgi:epoxyqueuosine reductase
VSRRSNGGNLSDIKTQQLTTRIKAEAQRLGFDLIGITEPLPPPHFDVYQRWLEAGLHSTMAYLASERALQGREDPRSLLPECQSIIVVATNYLPRRSQTEEGQINANIAAYALGDDYHDILVSRLKQLISFIKPLVGQDVPNRIYTDTGHLLERELAQRAGLGWIGKNTCLINPRHGSYFVLAELMLGIPLEVDQPFLCDRCGSCTRCVDSCPTGCILPDRTLDTRLCISFLTIEEKGLIPENLRSAIGGWIFGCDICQQVCPWNLRFAVPTTDSAFQSRPFLDQPDPRKFLALTPDTWRNPLRNSPLLRSKRRGLVRNAAIVTGNTRDAAAVPYLNTLLNDDPELLVRAHAAWALGRIGGEQVLNILKQTKRTEVEEVVLTEIERALNYLSL